MKSLNEQMDLIKKGSDEIIEEAELEKKVAESLKKNIPLKIKAGFDPTAPDIHLGHTVLIQKIKQFQDLGHDVHFLIGDFTGMIGDPTGRSKTRPPLTKEEVLENAKTYQKQIFKILDESKTTIVFNSAWMSPMRAEDLIKLCSNFTVARILERDDFSKRYKGGQPISFHEFMYPIIQGYDSVELKADVELGGTDQKFNLLMGRTLQRSYGQRPQSIVTMPLLEGLDGVKKMSKSYGNYIGVDEDIHSMYGKLMSVSDDLMFRYYELLTSISPAEIGDLKKSISIGKEHPMEVKHKLAHTITETFHGVDAADRAREEFSNVHSRRKTPQDIPVVELVSQNKSDGKIWIVHLLQELKLAKSGGDARRKISQGGVRIDEERISDVSTELDVPGEYMVQVGKKNFVKAKVL